MGYILGKGSEGYQTFKPNYYYIYFRPLNFIKALGDHVYLPLQSSSYVRKMPYWHPVLV